MARFQPPGFTFQCLATSLGELVFDRPIPTFWHNPTLDASSTPRLPLVFLHSLGGGSSAYEWSKVYPAFALQYDVIAPDLIGWGRSAHPVRDYSLEDYLTVLTELLTSLAQPPIVAATSLTAGVMIRLAIQRPDLVRSLFLVCPSGYGDFGVDYRRSFSALLAGTPGVDRLIYTLGAANAIAIRTFLQQVLFADPDLVTEEMVQAYLDSATQPRADYAALASLKGAICFDLARYLPQLTVPTMVIWGERSQLNSTQVGQRLADLNPQAIQTFVTIPDVGVLPHLESPAVVIGWLNHWLTKNLPEVDPHESAKI